MSDIMLQMGRFAFAVSSAQYQTLNRRTQYRWGTRERHGLKSTKQFLGLDVDSITLAGTLYPKVKSDLNLVSEMRQEGLTGEPFLLVSGNQNYGVFHGKWVLESVEETNTFFLRNGIPRKIEFTLTISEFGDD